MAGETTTTEMAAVIQTYIERTAYPQLAYNVVFDTHARLFPLPSGSTLRVPLLMPHNVIKSRFGEVPTTFSAASLIPQYVEAPIEFYGAYTDVTKKAAKASLIEAVRYARMQLEQQAARSVNRQFAIAISSQNGMRYRRVYTATASHTQYSGMTIGTSTSTTSFKVTPLVNEAKADFTGGQVFFTTGVNAGLGRRIKAFTTGASIITLLSALPQAPTVGDRVEITALKAISTGTSDRMNLADVFTAAELARRSGAQGFSPGTKVREDGWGIMRNVAGTVPQLVMFLDTQVGLDVMLDAATNGYTDVFKQTEAGLQRWSKGQFGLINNISFIGHNEGYRMSEAGVESDTGVVHTPTLVGMNSYFATKFRGVGNERNGLAFRTKTVGPQTWSVRHEAVIARIEWDVWLAAATQNGFHGNVFLCGTSSDA